jgi:uncharacterized tellurite resistance protein B-like protein
MNTDNQLLSEFSDQEKVAYLSAIASIATADRQATQEEAEFLQALGQTANLSEQQQQEVANAAKDSSNAALQQHLNTLKNSQLRFSLITDIISFAKSDGKYTPDEEARIKEVATYLGIDQQQYAALNQVVSQAEKARQQGQDVSQPNFLQSSGISDVLQKAGISSGMMKGMLALAAPLLLGRMFGGSAGVGRAAGVVGGGILGTILAKSGMLDGVLGGSSSNAPNTSGGNTNSGGLGSIFDVFKKGLGGHSTPGAGGGLGSVLTNILGGRRGF